VNNFTTLSVLELHELGDRLHEGIVTAQDQHLAALVIEQYARQFRPDAEVQIRDDAANEEEEGDELIWGFRRCPSRYGAAKAVPAARDSPRCLSNGGITGQPSGPEARVAAKPLALTK
jgi:hypothetical protein